VVSPQGLILLKSLRSSGQDQDDIEYLRSLENEDWYESRGYCKTIEGCKWTETNMPFSCQFQCREGHTKEIFSQQVGAADLAVARPLTASLGEGKQSLHMLLW